MINFFIRPLYPQKDGNIVHTIVPNNIKQRKNNANDPTKVQSSKPSVKNHKAAKTAINVPINSILFIKEYI